MKALLLSLLVFTSIFAQQVVEFKDPVPGKEVVELKQSNSNKIVIRLSFRNGSMCDPKGKEGLTAAVASLLTQGGTKSMSYIQIQDKIYPWAASYYSTVDKEVTNITFAVHKDFLNDFYAILKDLILKPCL